MNIVQMRIETDTVAAHAAGAVGMRSRHVISAKSGGNGQSLAGTGALVFEGELLELPAVWRPCARVH